MVSPRLTDLQTAATKKPPKRNIILYSDAEWHLLAVAMFAEWTASPDNLGLSVVQIANLAQTNQTKILLEGEPDPHVQWPKRHFTANNQLIQALTKIYNFINDKRRIDELFQKSNMENGNLKVQITHLKEELDALKAKKPALSDFAPADIIAEAAFIQAAQADAIVKSTGALTKSLDEVKDLLRNQFDSIVETNSEVKSQASSIVTSLNTQFQELKNLFNRPVTPAPQPAQQQKGKALAQRYKHHR